MYIDIIYYIHYLTQCMISTTIFWVVKCEHGFQNVKVVLAVVSFRPFASLIKFLIFILHLRSYNK